MSSTGSCEPRTRVVLSFFVSSRGNCVPRTRVVLSFFVSSRGSCEPRTRVVLSLSHALREFPVTGVCHTNPNKYVLRGIVHVSHKFIKFLSSPIH